MDIFLYVMGIVAAVGVLAVALVATVFIYLNYCSRHPMRKLRAEIFVVLFVGIASLVVRIVIGFSTLPHEALAGGAESLLYGILSTVSGLMFDGPTDLTSFAAADGFLVCLYYGIIAYAGFVILAVITVGVSYDFYSRIQTAFMRTKRHCSYYIFTSITNDSLVLATDIKKHEKQQKDHSFYIIFFEKSDESFSRKNPLHRKMMEEGFFYFSDSRCTDKGETVSFLDKFKFRRRHCIKDDVGKHHSKLFYVFAMDDSGDYEGENADVVFDDMEATLKSYIFKKRVKKTSEEIAEEKEAAEKGENGQAGGEGKGKGESGKKARKKYKEVAVNGLPTVVNYYVLTNGEVNYESYQRRTDEILAERLKALPEEFEWTDAQNPKPKSFGEYVDSEIQLNVLSEATLSSYSLINARKALLNKLGDDAFSLDSAPDPQGAYRVAVIGFGKTGQYAMEELYTHTAHLDATEGGYMPTQYIADIYDTGIDDKSGLFAYNHPLFRCIDEKGSLPAATKEMIGRAKFVGGKASEVIYSEYMEKSGKSYSEAKVFVDSRMAFPIAVLHKENCFRYPFMSGENAEMAISAACDRGVRDFVVALGNDERNIAMANMLIDSFRRLLLEASLKGEKPRLPHVKIYVNLIETGNKTLLNWRWEDDPALYTHPYDRDEGGNLSDAPIISVIPFGGREEMYSYDSFIEDYRERVYNYGYDLLSDILEAKVGEKAQKQKAYDEFRERLGADYNAYRDDEEMIDKWMTISQYLRLSNKSALAFSINYYKHRQARGALTDDDWDYMVRLEHERWSRFFISHGWVYAKYNKFDDFTGMTAEQKKAVKDREKAMRRGVKQHNCLCPFDEMLDDYTKGYDRGNVELGLVEGIVYGDRK